MPASTHPDSWSRQAAPSSGGQSRQTRSSKLQLEPPLIPIRAEQAHQALKHQPGSCKATSSSFTSCSATFQINAKPNPSQKPAPGAASSRIHRQSRSSSRIHGHPSGSPNCLTPLRPKGKQRRGRGILVISRSFVFKTSIIMSAVSSTKLPQNFSVF
ncbi:hypothetical protein SETIT_5G196600v2 [Setaria italica]|uniref:Uncharacterized protein n=1 Tax=Setaria italica TaxID=4555 RepID=A0A368R6X2_SETIT|nr:hypothetical protein SETIT_5G196600v2 [Setaria italica]